MLRLDWAAPAAADFERIQSFYLGVDARVATLLAHRVHGAIRQLREMPNSGRPGLRPGTRERVVAKSPYVLVYRVGVDAIEILHVYHERQDWTHANE